MNSRALETGSPILVTGAAGFIGFFLSKSLLERGFRVIGLDNLNDYYDVELKQTRLRLLQGREGFAFERADLADKESVFSVFERHRPAVAVNLAAQAGVRYSIDHPDTYIQSNIVGFFHVLEACRNFPVRHLVYASSSSVYGANQKVPFDEEDRTDCPVSLYAATKRSNELMAYTYSHLYHIPATGLRFFTVYGPYGRPDMAYFSFARQLFAGEPIRIFNNGDREHDLYRDFTYVDDIVEGIVRLIGRPPAGEEPHAVYNIGNSSPVKLMDFVDTLERCLSRAAGRELKFRKQFEPLKPGDVPATYAETHRIEAAVGFRPHTPLEDGLQRFADWYTEYYALK